MNKYDAFIHDYLVQHKQLTLEKIGVLQITADPKPETGSTTPVVQFDFDRKAETDPQLLDYIAEKSGKNRALVVADLSSYLEQVRQFINIGKPYVMPGIGAVFMVKNIGYEFSQQAGANFAASPSISSTNTEHYLEADPETAGRARTRNSLAGLAFVVLILVVAGVGWGIYSLVKNSGNNAPAQPEPATAVADQAQPADSAALPATPPSAAPAANTASHDGGYKFIFETTTNGERARLRTAQLQSFGDPATYDSVVQNGAVTYRLFFSHKVPATDTALIRDTLQRYFQREVRVE